MTLFPALAGVNHAGVYIGGGWATFPRISGGKSPTIRNFRIVEPWQRRTCKKYLQVALYRLILFQAIACLTERFCTYFLCILRL